MANIPFLVSELRNRDQKLYEAEQNVKYWRQLSDYYRIEYQSVLSERYCKECSEVKEDGKTYELCAECTSIHDTKTKLLQRIDKLREANDYWENLYKDSRESYIKLEKIFEVYKQEKSSLLEQHEQEKAALLELYEQEKAARIQVEEDSEKYKLLYQIEHEW